MPDRNDEYFLYQTLLGAFPLDDHQPDFRERLKAYMIKAVREAKVHTEWLKPDAAHEEAFLSFIDAILEPSEANEFLNDFYSFANKIGHYGMLNSLSQTVIKIASYGVPDFYQGTELWDLSFVDPDNRRPVDFERRTRLLQEIKKRESENLSSLCADLLSNWKDGRVKLYVIYKTLNFRRSHPELFGEGDYIPLRASGEREEHVCAFARRQGTLSMMAIVPRLNTRLAAAGEFPLGETAWRDSHLVLPSDAPGRWQNILTGENLTSSSIDKEKVLYLGEIFQRFPVALFSSA